MELKQGLWGRCAHLKSWTAGAKESLPHRGNHSSDAFETNSTFAKRISAMSRLFSILATASVCMCTWGCAQCDTCDDFPAPCIGPNCGMAGAYAVPNHGPIPATAPATPAAPATGVSTPSDAAEPIAPPPPSVTNPKPGDVSPPKPMDLGRPNN